MTAIWLLLLAVLAWPATAHAHTMGTSRGEYAVHGDEVTATLFFRAEELTQTPEEIIADTAIEADGHRCQPSKVSSAPDAPDGLRIIAHYDCGRSPARLHIHAGFLDRLPGGHAHVATVVDDAGHTTEHLTVLAQPDVDAAITGGEPASTGFLGFVRAGVEHIATGADHMLFLLGLVLLPRESEQDSRKRLRSIVLVLTAFTVGHSVSLAIATLGGIAPSARIVEPLVALSVAYVGAENLLARKDPSRRRWLITLPFGLVHGFAFASGLLIVHLPRKDLPLALVGFNLGVEIGQLVVMAIVLPCLWLVARRKPRGYDVLRRVLSAGVLVCGLGWFVQRVLQR
jgi:hydrogenase/urease accessory protein HupE